MDGDGIAPNKNNMQIALNTRRNTMGNHRQDSESTVLDDETSRKLLQVVMLKQKLREEMHQCYLLNEKMEKDALEYYQNRQRSSGESSKSVLMIKPKDSGPDECEIVMNNDLLVNLLADENLDYENINYEELPEDLNRTLSERIIEWVSINQEEIVDRLITTRKATIQLSLGGGTGYLTALLIKIFGKAILYSLTGGFILIKIAHSKGYIGIDWNKIYCQLEHHGNEEPDLPQNGDDQDIVVHNWVKNKISSLKKWSKENSYVAASFVCGFIFKSFS